MKIHALIAIAIAVVAIAAPIAPTPAAHAQSAPPLQDQVAQVQKLTSAGRLDEAEALLATLDVPDGVRGRLRGVIAIERDDFAAAANHLRAALAAEAKAEAERGGDAAPDPQVSLYLAHCYVRLGQFERALDVIEDTRSLATQLVAQPLVEAHALHGAGRLGEAYEVLRGAAARFADDTAPQLELIALAEELSLRTAARQQAARLLELDIDRETALAMIHALHRDPDALPILERLIARFSDDSEIRAHTAHAYAAAQQWYAAGLLFEQATRLGGDYAFEAADQYRLANAPRRALAMNGRVAEPARRLRQRLSILYTAGEMARVVALEAELSRRGLEDEPTLYRLAYAHFALGEYVRATRLARRLIGTGFEPQARSLLTVMGRAVGPRSGREATDSTTDN